MELLLEVRYIATNCIYVSMHFSMCVYILYESSKDDSNDYEYINITMHMRKEPHAGSKVYANV